jgi:hypothetical protein
MHVACRVYSFLNIVYVCFSSIFTSGTASSLNAKLSPKHAEGLELFEAGCEIKNSNILYVEIKFSIVLYVQKSKQESLLRVLAIEDWSRIVEAVNSSDFNLHWATVASKLLNK